MNCADLSYVAIIPTMGLPHARTMIHSAAENAEGKGLFLLSVNPQLDDLEDARFRVSEFLEEFQKRNPSKDVSIRAIFADGPLGFGGAVNAGINWIMDNGGLPDDLFILNDDLVLTKGWRIGMSQALRTEEINTMGRSAAGYKDSFPLKKLSPKSKGMGMVGACSNVVAGSQKVDAAKAIDQVGISEFARNFKMENCGDVYFTDFLSGLCLAISRDAVKDVLMVGNQLFEVFTCGGYEDNDLCYRIQSAGWMMGIVSDVFVFHHGSQTLDTVYADSIKGLINRSVYYEKWAQETQKDHKVIGAYRVAIKTINDLIQLKQSIIRAAKFLDGFSVLLTNSPSEALTSYDGVLVNQLPDTDKLIFSASEGGHAPTMLHWLRELLLSASEMADPDYARWKTLVPDGALMVEKWEGSFNERDERNRTHEMAEALGADFIMSIDSDEIIEDRITRRIFQRQLHHPDPLVRYFHTGWINHWESQNLVRTDPPFATGLLSGMIGPRLWKVNKAAPYRIVGGSELGLHCGNAPPHCKLTGRVSSIRFRHLSYIRSVDRASKFAFYQNIDKEKNPAMLGGESYHHLVKQEKVEVSVYNPSNGIGSYMLCYEKESPVGVGIWLDNFYSVTDRSLMVWTGEFKKKDQRWIHNQDALEIIGMGEETFNKKYKTGPRYKVAILTKLFNCEVIASRFIEEDGLAKCRNAALDYLQNAQSDPDSVLPNNGMGWAVFADPDEMVLDDYRWQSSLRRCAEINDCWAFVTTFRNQLAGGSWSTSESIRLSRLHPVMRMDGRIHEGFDGVLGDLHESGNKPNVQRFPIEVFNTGLAQDPESMRTKLERYTRILLLELNENPFDAASWTALGLQFVNEDNYEQAKICFERGMMSGGRSHLPYRELATVQAQELLATLVQALHRVGRQNEGFVERASTVVEAIKEMFPPHPRVETYGTVCQDIELPPFPYDRISCDERGVFTILEEAEDGKEEVS